MLPEATLKGPVDAWGNRDFALRKVESVPIGFNKGMVACELWVEWGAIRQVLSVTLASYTTIIFSQIVWKRTLLIAAEL